MRIRRISAVRTALVLAALGAPGWSATWTGGGETDRWSEPANWGGALPSAGEDLVFAGTRRQACVNDLAAETRFRSLIFADGGFSISGRAILLTKGVVGSAKANRISCALASEGLSMSVPANGSLVLGPVAIAAEASCEVSGELTIAGPVTGTGGIAKSGTGVLALIAVNSYAGETTVRRGTLRIGSDCVLGRDGGCGSGGGRIIVDGGTIEVDTVVVETPIVVGRRGARIAARTQERTLASTIATPATADGLTASFFNESLRDQRHDDWRKVRTSVSNRSDGPLHFPYAVHALFPSADAQRQAGLAIDSGGAARYSVQWDGFVAVPSAGTRLSASTSDGCRACLDLDRDGTIAAGEWFQDAWGWGHDPPMMTNLGPELAPGVYPLRIQFEQVGALGGFTLLWDDAGHSAAKVDGRAVVPAEFLTGVGAIEICGDHPLRLSGTLMGAAWLLKSGASTLTLGGSDRRTGRTIVRAGALRIDAAEVLPGRAMHIVAGATLRLAGFDQRIGALSGAGAVDLGANTLTLGADHESSTFAGTISGAGGLRKIGSGTILLTGASTYTGHTDVTGGTLRRSDGTLALRVDLRAPITTIVPLPTPAGGSDRTIDAQITVPADAPTDLGVGAFIVDQHGQWFQRIDRERLRVGRNHRRFALGPDEHLACQPGLASWSALQAGVATRAGLFFWSASAAACSLGVEGRIGSAAPAQDAAPFRLTELMLPTAPARTGERWSVSVSPIPFPANPYDPDQFALDAIVTRPDGSLERIAGFYEQPMSSSDRGDREELVPASPGRFSLRLRPRTAGTYVVRLVARWKDRTVEVPLPAIVVTGRPWDGYVRVDRADPRFFRVGSAAADPADRGAFHWPIGMSLRSINDTLGARSMQTRLTPERGTLSYAAYLARFGRSGGDTVEIWMASWNLALEWRADWPGFHGMGIYNQENAWRLDRILDLAWAEGVRVNLVLHNHGQASNRDDHEWKDNPYNRDLGGPLASPAQLFTDAQALAGQERLRRYILARYADHPAVFGWKLWTEINLTASNPAALRAWHERAAARWHELDVYGHPVTTHWSGDYRAADRAIVALPMIDYICL
ncbi:MAG: autotransporter-associated beta strand repeat-containing protein, partial [Planctomycetes bacterium]|nr:autotransporter-associated beta strand repeat-containing protein [Planctomycetota bacterium]